MLRQQGDDLFSETRRLPLQALGQTIADGGKQGDLVGLRSAAEDGYPLHEEFVEVGREDRQELRPFQRRGAFVRGLSEHAIVEVKPTEVAIPPHIGKCRRKLPVEYAIVSDRSRRRCQAHR